MPSLDAHLNMTLARLRIIEEALHGQHLWTLDFVWGPEASLHVPAEIRILDDGVQFVAKVPADVPYIAVGLDMDGDVVQTMIDPHHSDHAYLYIWEIKVESPLAVG